VIKIDPARMVLKDRTWETRQVNGGSVVHWDGVGSG